MPQEFLHPLSQDDAQAAPQTSLQPSPQVDAQATPQLLAQLAAPQPTVQSATQSLPHPLPQADVQPPEHRALFRLSSTTCRTSSKCRALSLVTRAVISSFHGKVSLPL
ncbi:MAG: hypothetical protein LBJ25_03900 [Candidatus Margulisbacteria bacterium]|jgi:hypothetical protein|nr:hypothetical protein [Candidatus Margulisiibacteriota bacterium]